MGGAVALLMQQDLLLTLCANALYCQRFAGGGVAAVDSCYHKAPAKAPQQAKQATAPQCTDKLKADKNTLG
jgi:hypothetical protein